MPVSTSIVADKDAFYRYFEVRLPNEASSDSKELARRYARQVRDMWNAGDSNLKPLTYVNYAFGDESVESMYGHDAWRLERLRGLKQKYDPANAFRYYNPIVQGNATHY
jgi:hypothetical protein